MIKYFCDKCDGEITESNQIKSGPLSRLGVEVSVGAGKMEIEVITSWNGTANAGCFCKYCVLDALAKLDDRPRAA